MEAEADVDTEEAAATELLFADGEPDDEENSSPQPTRDPYSVSLPRIAALRRRILLVRAQLDALLQELDDLCNGFPPAE